MKLIKEICNQCESKSNHIMEDKAAIEWMDRSKKCHCGAEINRVCENLKETP